MSGQKLNSLSFNGISGSGGGDPARLYGPHCERIRDLMESSKPLPLRSSTGVSLHERFSQVLVDQVSRSRNVALDRIMTQRRRVSGAPGVVLLLQKDPPSVLGLQAPHVKQRWRRRQSVWERLGWQQVSRLSFPRPQGFWSFINKYRWRTRITSTLMRRGRLRSRLGQHHIPTKTNVQKLTAGPRQRPQLNLQMGRAAATWRRSKDNVPTKRQLDAELDEYMSLSKTRLDKELDEYMSLSRSRLDAQLDEYMSMAGQMPPQWD